MKQSLHVCGSHLKISGLVAVAYGLNVKVDEPDEGVLVHGLYVGQVRYTEEEDGGMCGNWSVAISSLVYLHFCRSCHLLLG